jgi:hypothetical protein
MVGPTFFGRDGPPPGMGSAQRRQSWLGSGQLWLETLSAMVILVGLVSMGWGFRASAVPVATTVVKKGAAVQENGHGSRQPVADTSAIAVDTDRLQEAENAKTDAPETPTANAQMEPSAQPLPTQTEGEDALVRASEIDDRPSVEESLRRAISRGDVDAPVRLANLFLEGRAVTRNCDEAMALLESAAAKGNVRARNRLAGLYSTGSCVQRDRVQAYRWLKSALDADPTDSWAQQNRDLTWREMTAEERNMIDLPVVPPR